MAAETDHWRNTLRNIAWDGEDAGLSLTDALKAFSRGKFTETGKGDLKVLVGASGQGKSATYQLPAGSTITEVTAWASRFIDLYDEARGVLVNAGDAAPSDSEILTEMMDRLRPIQHAISDFRSIRDPVIPPETEVLAIL